MRLSGFCKALEVLGSANTDKHIQPFTLPTPVLCIGSVAANPALAACVMPVSMLWLIAYKLRVVCGSVSPGAPVGLVQFIRTHYDFTEHDNTDYDLIVGPLLAPRTPDVNAE